MSDLVGTAEAAANIGISQSWLAQEIRAGNIKAVKQNRHWYITEDEIARYKRQHPRRWARQKRNAPSSRLLARIHVLRLALVYNLTLPTGYLEAVRQREPPLADHRADGCSPSCSGWEDCLDPGARCVLYNK